MLGIWLDVWATLWSIDAKASPQGYRDLIEEAKYKTLCPP